MPVNQTDSWSATGLVKRAPIGREPTVISFGKAACAPNRGNGRVALVKACWFTQSSGHAQRENMDTEADEEVIEHTSGTLPKERENVTDRGSCRVELAQWKDKKTKRKTHNESQSKETFRMLSQVLMFALSDGGLCILFFSNTASPDETALDGR